MSIGRLVVDFVANTAGFETDTKRAAKALEKQAKEIDRQIARIGKAAAAVGAAAAAGFAVLAKNAIDSANALQDLSEKTGISVESLSELKYAAELSATDIDSLAVGMQQLAKRAADAAKGTRSSVDAFSAVGVSATNADGSLKGLDELLGDLAESFSQYEDGSAKAAAAQAIFGKSGADLIPFLNKGRDGIADLRREAADLGQTISKETALAAAQFNDNLNKMGKALTGVANQVVEDLLPGLSELSDEWVRSAKSSMIFEGMARTIATAIKGIVDAALGAWASLQKLGNAIGATAAAAVQAAQLNFSEAAEIWRSATADNLAIEAEYQRMRAAIWSDGGQKVVAEAKKASEDVKKVLRSGGGESELQEVRATAARIDISPTEAYYRELDELTKTHTEKQVSEYAKQKEALNQLLESQRISVAQYNARIEEMISGSLGLEEFEVTLKKVDEKVEESVTHLSEFQKQAARNTQDIIADTLINGFDKGAKGVLDSFYQMITQMAAQAAAANIAGKLFGQASGGTGGGWIGTAVSWLGSIFGGARATGGPVNAGMVYRVNEREPEFFKPRGSGDVIPLSKMAFAAPSRGVTQNIYVQGRVDQRTARQMELESLRRQRVANARLG